MTFWGRFCGCRTETWKAYLGEDVVAFFGVFGDVLLVFHDEDHVESCE
jgi:hypothetical protein